MTPQQELDNLLLAVCDDAKDENRACQLIIEGANVNFTLSKGITPLHRMASNNWPTALNFALERCSNVNPGNDEGDTPLHWAAYLGRKQIVRMILDAGARIDEKNNLGATPRQFAEAIGEESTAELLDNYAAALKAATVIGKADRLKPKPL